MQQQQNMSFSGNAAGGMRPGFNQGGHQGEAMVLLKVRLIGNSCIKLLKT